jgi:glycosyltransferase involved in cell wall biosynthesis
MLRELSRSADVLLSIDRILPPIPDRPQVLMCNTLAYLNEATAAASPSWTSIVVPSSHFERQVRQVNPVSRTHLVPYAISPATLERTSEMTPATGHRVRLPHRPDRRKGHVEAIKGLARAVGSTEPIDIDIAWLDEPKYEEYRRELQSIAEREGVADRVHFFGWMDDDARWRGTESAQAVLQLGSFEETFGLAVVEAVLCGRLAITRPQPAIREIVGSTPLLVEIDDPFNWIDALERSVAATRDARAIKDARQHLAAFTMTSMARGYDAVLRQALSQVGGRS